MPVKKILKTLVKPDDQPNPATVIKNNENKESACKLTSTLKDKIPRVHSPAKREELSNLFCGVDVGHVALLVALHSRLEGLRQVMVGDRFPCGRLVRH